MMVSPRCLAALAVRWFLVGATAAVPPLSGQGRATAPAATAFALDITRVIQNGPPVTLDFRGISAGGVARLDVVGGSDAASFPAGGYLLVFDSSGAARLVDSIHRSVKVIGAGARLGGLVELHTPPGTVTEVVVTIDSLGPGEPLEGRATQRYRLTTSFSLALESGGQVVHAQSTSVTELWQDQAADRIPNPFIGLGGDAAPGDFLAPLNRVLAEKGHQLPGLTLRSETKASLSAGGVAFTRQRVTTRVSGVHSASGDHVGLQLPSGFTTMRE
jgi:hypothetical protein